MRRSLSAIFGFRAGASGDIAGEGVEAHQSFVAGPAQLVEGHRDGGFAKAQHDAIGHRRGAGPIVVGQAGQAGARALGEAVAHLSGRRDARAASGTGYLPRRPKLALAMELLAGTAWLPAGGSQGRPPPRSCLTGGCNCRTALRALLAELASQLNPALGRSTEGR